MTIDEATYRKVYSDGQRKGIEDCLKILCFHQNEWDGIHWAIREIEELKEMKSD